MYQIRVQARQAVLDSFQEAKTVDTTSIDALREMKDKLSKVLDHAREVGVAEPDLLEAEKRRRKLHNGIEDLKGSIRVFCRARPISQKEIDQGDSQCHKIIDTMTIEVDGQKFGFDSVFGPGTQDEVFEDCRDLVQSVADGYNVTIFAYGQTGAGKTFTMYGPKERFPDGREDPRRPIVPLRGVVPRTLEEVFATKETMKDTHTVTVLGSMIELYRNDLRDLIVQRKDGQPPEKLNCRLDKGVVIVVGMQETEVQDTEELLELMTSGMENRKVAATSMNPDSSRSHCMFIVKF